MIKLTVPFNYQIEYVVKRKRTVESVTALSTTYLEIQAPRGPTRLAFELGCSVLGPEAHRTKHRCRSAFYAPAGETVNVYRAENAYWAEICHSVDAPAQIADRCQMAKDPFNVLYQAGDNGFDLSLFPAEIEETRQKLEAKHQKDGGLRRWDDDASKGITATALLIHRRALHDLREIDGKLCMRVSEPALGYATSYESGAGTASSSASCYLIADQSVRTTPAGFQLHWDLSPGNIHRWRIDETAAAIDFDAALSETGSRALTQNSVTLGAMDLSECLFDGRARMLEDAINRVRNIILERRIPQTMNGAELSTFLELQQIFDRDAGRLSPDYVLTATRLLALMEKHVPAKVRNSIYYTHEHGLQTSLPVGLRYLRTALEAFGARPQDGREWIDRALPCGVLADPSSNRDVIEVLTMRDGQRLVDAGCDRSLLEALQQAAVGEAHVLCIEESDGTMLPYAGVLVQSDRSAWRLSRTIGPPGSNASTVDAAKAFESFAMHANALDAENEALLSLAI
jgi:hypothetical protein